LQWKPEQQSVALSDMRKAMLPEEALVGPGRKGQEKCAIIVEGGRVLGYTYFYLSTDGLNRVQLKKRMVDLDSDAYTIGVIGHFYRKGYLKR